MCESFGLSRVFETFGDKEIDNSKECSLETTRLLFSFTLPGTGLWTGKVLKLQVVKYVSKEQLLNW